MRSHATAQHIGDRSHQCDATATYTHDGTRSYVLLDGIGSSDAVRAWTRSTARHLARAAAQRGAEPDLRAIHAVAAAERRRDGWRVDDAPTAVAVVAVARPDAVDIAWCGDARAYVLTPSGALDRLTTDHNLRQFLLASGIEPGPYSRNQVTSYLGDTSEDFAIGTVTRYGGRRLLLASDGAYEPLEDAGCDLTSYLWGAPARVARAFVSAAIDHAPDEADNATVLVVDLDAARATLGRGHPAVEPVGPSHEARR